MTKLILADICFWFHWVWVGVLLTLSFASIKYPNLCTLSRIVTFTTLTSQIIWLGCPIVTLENKLRGVPYTGSFICSFLQNTFGINIPSWVVFVSLLGILILNIILCTRVNPYKWFTN